MPNPSFPARQTVSPGLIEKAIVMFLLVSGQANQLEVHVDAACLLQQCFLLMHGSTLGEELLDRLSLFHPLSKPIVALEAILTPSVEPFTGLPSC